jgi:hypothetical protein
MKSEQISKLERANKWLKGSRRAIAAGEAAGPAINALVGIMSDPAFSVPKRIQAAEGLLGFKSPADVAEAAKLFLCSVFSDPDQNIDHRLAATSALRKSEDVRIMPPIERPPPRVNDVEEPQESLAELVAKRRARQELLEVEMAAAIEQDLKAAEVQSHKRSRYNGNANGNGSAGD